MKSFPTRERGLKSQQCRKRQGLKRSFPTRERGLKLIECHLRSGGYFVVPHAGTWIEILNLPVQFLLNNRRSPRGNVDWNSTVSPSALPRGVVPHAGTWIEILYSPSLKADPLCRSPRGNVDWNLTMYLRSDLLVVVPHAGTWIEIFKVFSRLLSHVRRSPRGNVDWNSTSWLRSSATPASFPTRERGLKCWAGSLFSLRSVVPHAGTWIEIKCRRPAVH